MKKILIILFTLIFSNCIGQDKSIEFKELPKAIKLQVDSLHHGKIFKRGDTLYLVKFRFKRELYRGDGFKMNHAHYTGDKGNIIGWTIFTFTSLFVIGMFFGI